MPLDAGLLRHRLTFQSLTRYLDTDGDTVEDWLTAFTVWGAVEPLSAREFVSSQAVQSEVVARMTIRYRADVDPKMRILHRGQVFAIAGVLPDKESGLEYLTLAVSQGVSPG
jgi:SPP1 family predicted phage head-tail adaptor